MKDDGRRGRTRRHGGTPLRRVLGTLMALAVVAMMLSAPAGGAGAAQQATRAAAAVTPPPGVPAGSVQIPHTVLTVNERIVTYNHDTNGPEGFCYYATYLVFDGDTYGYPESTAGTVSVHRYDTEPGHPQPVSQPYVTKGPKPLNVGPTNPLYGRVAYGGNQHALMVNQFLGHGYFSDYTDFRMSECSPTRYANYHTIPQTAAAERLELWTVGPPEVKPELDVRVNSGAEGNLEIGDRVPVTVTLRNPNVLAITNLSLGGGSGLRFGQDHLALVSGPDTTPPTSLQPGASVDLRYEVEVLASGNLEVATEATGTYDGKPLAGRCATVLNVPPKVTISLANSVTTATKVGDQFTVTATLTNDEDVAVTGVRAEPLSSRPLDVVSPVSGPTGPGGTDPRVDQITIPAKGSVDITWVYRADKKDTAQLTAQVSGRDPREGSLFFLSAETSVTIEAPGIEISDLHLQPGAPVPGDFGNLRGTVTNIGSLDVTDIDFTLESAPELKIALGPLAKLDPSVSPRIPTLAVGESREFLIPVAMITDPGGLATYTADVTMTGTAEVGGEDTEVTTVGHVGGGLDLSTYWMSIWDDVWRQLQQDTLDFFEGVNTWGDTSTLAGVSVGSGQGVLNAFQKLGDGLLKPIDILGQASGDGGQKLTEDGKAIVAAVREYYNTTSLKKMTIDFANVRDDITVGGVGIFAEWMRNVDKAATDGDYRKVAELITEPATDVALGFGTEKAGGQLFAKLLQQPMVRRTLSAFQKAPEVPDAPTPAQIETIVDADYADLKDIPTGVRVTGQTVARAGLTAEEHAWMIEQAKEHGVAFFVRPRPAEAAKWAKLGFNAKPMAIKLKSITDLDHEWLGYPDKKGVVVFREPTDPLEAMMKAVDAGELEEGSKLIDDIIERYNLRKAEWESYRYPFGKDGPEFDPKEGFVRKLRGDKLLEGGGIMEGDGFDVQRYGKKVRTGVSIDAEGQVIFSHNNQPVFSDIDLLSIAMPDGSAIDPALHRKLAKAAGFGIDGQHGDSVMTSDFPDWATAKKFATQYAGEHMRGGDPLVIVQPDVTTLGYVDGVDVPDGNIPGSDYELYGKITTTYEGAGRR